MKKIIIVTQYLSGLGGTETVLRNAVMQINKRSDVYKAQLYLLGGSGDTEWLTGLPFDTYTSDLNNRLFRVYNKFHALYQYLKKEQPSIVISIDTKLIRGCFICRKFLKKKFPIISWMHFSLFHEPLVDVKLLPYADFHFCISSGIAKQMESLGITPSTLYTIYNPVSCTSSIITRPEGKVNFIYIGRIWFEKQKRMKDLLTALSKVSGNWQLNVYGDGEDSIVCKEFAKQVGIQDKIIWHGWVKDAWSDINQATALLLTSAYEGFPMVLAEAISRGVYCISSDCETGPSELIKQNVNGELFQPGDLSSLQKILQDMVTGEKTLPDQKKIKDSIEFLYADHYYHRLLSVIDEIIENWNF
ncbi:glycosyltransferase [Sporolactobacillus putidus]|uniref:Lipopolysaccharide 1,6-galactosyltransferase n=1 Tax=Sporolactobacillus putidus TaxID=492735 RepID=A0A917S1F0_9BACL|nr:glycosyltransferase [Sporolactobacillus putidus]GGL50666.1 lipopolysaccharide 1,6-galactosyltransferase [Sporolactobacillus putidus]